MMLERTAVALQPRTASGCLDMAVMFIGRHLVAVAGLWFLVAAPSCALVYLVSNSYDVGLWMPVLVCLFASGPLGVMLGVGTSENVFGEPLTVRGAVQHTLHSYFKTFLTVSALRIALMLALLAAVIPGLLLAVRLGFLVEQAVLHGVRNRGGRGAQGAAVSLEFGDLVVRGAAIVVFCAILLPVLFFSLDLTFNLVFGYPIFFGRLLNASKSYNMGEYVWQLLWYDPRVQTALTATALAVYSIGRIAWFFCYVDLQVRRDCWDIQVQFAQEARRLEALDHASTGETA